MLNGRNRLIVLFFGAVLLLAVVSANASTVTYTDPTAWGNATSGDQEITFNGIAPSGSFTNEGTSTGLTIDGVQFIGQLTANTNALNVTDEFYAAPYFDWGVPATLESPIYNLPANPTFMPYIQVNLPANTTAFSALLGTVSPNGLTYQVTLSDGEVFTIGTGTRPNLTFFGITTDSSNAIAWADFTVLNPGTYSGTYGILTDFQFGANATGGSGQGQDQGAPQVPEACTLILIGSGLVAMRAFRKHLPTLA
jgi:hypothetical protein